MDERKLENQDIEKGKAHDAAKNVAFVGVFVPHSEVDEHCGLVLLDGITEAAGNIVAKEKRERKRGILVQLSYATKFVGMDEL